MYISDTEYSNSNDMNFETFKCIQSPPWNCIKNICFLKYDSDTIVIQYGCKNIHDEKKKDIKELVAVIFYCK